MKLLFKRNQTSGSASGVTFKLWGKLETDQSEDEIIRRYKFDQAMLIEAAQPELMRNTIAKGAAIAVLVFILMYRTSGYSTAVFLALAAGAGFGYWWYHNNRDTIFVKDLLHGRYFACKSVIELAQKEAWLEQVTSFLRQVMESAKHWDGTETIDIPPLPKAEAKYLMLKGL